MKVTNITEAEAALAKFVPLTKELLGKDLSTQQMLPILAAAGHPEKRLKFVHIAGTSGKTSTSYFTAALLLASGAKVGLTVSPHIDTIRERVQINGTPISEAKFCAYLEQFLSIIESLEFTPTYFELLVGFAIWVFAQEGMNYAVLETGLGGLHDSTNVIDDPTKVCVLTDIGYDHLHVLGNTLPEIASQKAGIMHTGNQAFCYQQTPEVMQVFEDYARKVGATLHSVEPAQATSDSDTLYQQHNWYLAYQAFQYIANRDGLDAPAAEARHATQILTVPGRMETFVRGDKTIVFDGAHNEQKMAAFVESFQAKFPGQKAVVLNSFKRSKDYYRALELLLPITSELIITKFLISQDLQANPALLDEIAIAAQKIGFAAVQTESDPYKAFALLEKSHATIGVITGSLYLVSQLHQYVKTKH